MSARQFEIPADWQVQGDPPSRASAPQRLAEDLFSVCAPDADLSLDIGWRPAADPAGSFVCSLIVGDGWDAPVDTLITKDANEVHAWIEATLEVMRGMAGTESQQPVAGEKLVDFGGAPAFLSDSGRDRRAA
jgi:hypothetical protein